ncbi:MAG: GTPase Era [Candidatus Omnitrophica bacterium]|nr:GTPase Era [Candidatus Omnitrophota bacterium]MCM8826841.1 GTPase Era [Candidatus Omnitrophota bacterium]
MKEEKSNFKCGFVAIIGRPNVGKSTLMNALVCNKISIVSDVPQTTRYLIKGILNWNNTQVVFVDSPGMHAFKDSLTEYLNDIAKKSLVDVELVLYVVDMSRPPGLEETKIMDFLVRKGPSKVIMVLNKIDVKRKFINEYIDLWQKKIKENNINNPIVYYIPVSAKLGKNLDKLKEAISEQLPFSPPFYDKDVITDFPLKFRLADIIREKIFLNLKEEIPHSTAVEVMDIEDKGNVFYISTVIYVNRKSQKRIVIGKGGEMLAKIGKSSRLEIEKILNKKVYLELWVKVLPNWQDKPRILRELGYEGV